MFQILARFTMDNPPCSTQIKLLFCFPFYIFTFKSLSPSKEIFHFSFFTFPLKGVSPFFTLLPFYPFTFKTPLSLKKRFFTFRFSLFP